MTGRFTARSSFMHVVLFALAMVSLLPFVWLVCATLKRPEDFFTYSFLPPDPHRWTLENFSTLFRAHPFARWLTNSLFLACTQTVVVVTLSSLGGFALAKYRFRFRKPLMILMLATMLIPYQVLLPSLRLMMYHFGWINSYAAILVPNLVSVFGMLLFMQAMRQVPDELLQAARVDGCSELRLWWDVALPVVRPMIGAFTLLSFMANWNSYLWPQIVLQDAGKYTLPIALSNMMATPESQTNYGVLMAGTLLSILPVGVLFFVLQRDFIAGLASGAVKG
jgi:ABC-type glycerol-3-phosphate transport system permease component